MVLIKIVDKQEMIDNYENLFWISQVLCLWTESSVNIYISLSIVRRYYFMPLGLGFSVLFCCLLFSNQNETVLSQWKESLSYSLCLFLFFFYLATYSCLLRLGWCLEFKPSAHVFVMIIVTRETNCPIKISAYPSTVYIVASVKRIPS